MRCHSGDTEGNRIRKPICGRRYINLDDRLPPTLIVAVPGPLNEKPSTVKLEAGVVPPRGKVQCSHGWFEFRQDRTLRRWPITRPRRRS